MNMHGSGAGDCAAGQSISVIIATKNRAHELGTISLPSLAKQYTRDFEIIIWDASDGEESRQAVQEFAAANPDLQLRYYKAPRVGIPAQRNDAVKAANGAIIFFIDDDSEVSPDGVSELRNFFAAHESLAGGCLPLDYRWPGKEEGQPIVKTRRLRDFPLLAYGKVFFGNGKDQRSIPLSGTGPGVFPREAGRVDHLWGCDMAFRKEIFLGHRFDERLQKYSGMAFEEDNLFSHRLHREGFVLSIAERGLVIHRAAPGDRVSGAFNEGRVRGYNSAVFWRTSIFPFVPWSVIPFLWLRAGVLGLILLRCLRRPWQKARWQQMAGHLAGLWGFMLDEIRGCTPGPPAAASPNGAAG